MREKKYTAALIGTGRIGFTLGFDSKREQPASHTMALLANKRIDLLAGCDNNSSRLAHWHRFVKKSDVFAEYSFLFATTKVDVVVIAVNETFHLETALAAIRFKPKLIILEKPVALNAAQGEQILLEAKKHFVPIMINHERRFALDYAFAKKYIKNIGKILSINARLDSGLRVFSAKEESTGEYSLLHDGTHLVDIILFLLEDEQTGFKYNFEDDGKKSCLSEGRITSLVCDEKDSSVVRSLNVHFSSEKCADINMVISGESRFFGFEVDVIGAEGRIRIGNGIFEFYKRAESKLYSGFYSLEKDSKVKSLKKTKYFSNMVKNAVDFLDQKEPLRSPLASGLRTLYILEDLRSKIMALISR